MTGSPITPPAALINTTASSIASIIGTPSGAPGPVIGRNTPSDKTPFSGRFEVVLVVAATDVPGVTELSSPEHAPTMTTSDAAANALRY